jgi:hypothetical protein
VSIDRIPPPFSTHLPGVTPGRGERIGAPAPVRAPEESAAHVSRPEASIAPRGASLWDLLSEEERAFFATPAGSATTYRASGRSAPQPSGPIGQRVDLEA